MTRRHLALLVLVSASLFVATACNDDDTTTTTEDPEFVPDPNDTADDSVFAFTPRITITDSGFEPRTAVAVFGETLTFVNATGRAQTITFTNGSPRIGGDTTIGPIPPGESMSFPEELDTAVSLVYECDGLPGQQGHLQIDPGVGTL